MAKCSMKNVFLFSVSVYQLTEWWSPLGTWSREPRVSTICHLLVARGVEGGGEGESPLHTGIPWDWFFHCSLKPRKCPGCLLVSSCWKLFIKFLYLECVQGATSCFPSEDVADYRQVMNISFLMIFWVYPVRNHRWQLTLYLQGIGLPNKIQDICMLKHFLPFILDISILFSKVWHLQ